MKFLHIPSAIAPLLRYTIPQKPSPKTPKPALPSGIDVNVPNLNLIQTSLSVLVNINVDWEMCVDVSHLILEALSNANDQVVDDSSDSSEGSNVLSRAVVEFDVDDIFLGVGEVDGQVVQVLRELA